MCGEQPHQTTIETVINGEKEHKAIIGIQCYDVQNCEKKSFGTVSNGFSSHMVFSIHNESADMTLECKFSRISLE